MSQTIDVGEDKFVVEKRDQTNFPCPIRECDVEALIIELALQHNIKSESIKRKLEEREALIRKEHEESLRKKREWRKAHEAKEKDPLYKLRILYPRRHLRDVRDQMDKILQGLGKDDLHSLLSRIKGIELSPHFTYDDGEQLSNLVSFHLQTKK